MYEALVKFDVRFGGGQGSNVIVRRNFFFPSLGIPLRSKNGGARGICRGPHAESGSVEHLSKSLLDRLGHLFLRKVAVTRPSRFFSFFFFPFFFFYSPFSFTIIVFTITVCGLVTRTDWFRRSQKFRSLLRFFSFFFLFLSSPSLSLFPSRFE